MVADPVRGVSDFSMAGDGIVIEFRNSDLAELQRTIGDDWVQSAIDKFSASDFPMLELLIKHGAKKDATPVSIDLDTINQPLSVIYEAVIDGLCFSVFGRDYKDQVAHLAEQIAELENKSPPRVAP